MGSIRRPQLGRGGANLRAIVGFHPGLPTARPEASSHIGGTVRVFVGAGDLLIPPRHRLDFENEMRAAGVDWAMHLYGDVAHSFTHP